MNESQGFDSSSAAVLQTNTRSRRQYDVAVNWDHGSWTQILEEPPPQEIQQKTLCSVKRGGVSTTSLFFSSPITTVCVFSLGNRQITGVSETEIHFFGSAVICFFLPLSQSLLCLLDTTAHTASYEQFIRVTGINSVVNKSCSIIYFLFSN